RPGVHGPAEDAQRVAEGVGDARFEVESVGDAADDLPPEDEVDPVVLVEAEVPDVGVHAERLAGRRVERAAPPAVLGAVVVAPLRAIGGGLVVLGAGAVGLVPEAGCRVTARGTDLKADLEGTLEEAPLGLERATELGDRQLLVEVAATADAV